MPSGDLKNQHFCGFIAVAYEFIRDRIAHFSIQGLALQPDSREGVEKT